MKKLGDALRMLSSVLLGIVIKDSDALTDALHKYFHDPLRTHTSVADTAAWLVPLVLTAVFVRNIHGSAQYDAHVDEGYSPSFERNGLGRFGTFLMALGGLFAGPFLADHLLTAHAAGLTGKEIGAVLFCPILVYTAWDASLWLASQNQSESAMNEIAWRWLVIDACAWVVVLALGTISLRERANGLHVPAELSTLCFLAVAVGTIVVDYVWNSQFYFPPSKSEPKVILAPTATETSARDVYGA